MLVILLYMILAILCNSIVFATNDNRSDQTPDSDVDDPNQYMGTEEQRRDLLSKLPRGFDATDMPLRELEFAVQDYQDMQAKQKLYDGRPLEPYQYDEDIEIVKTPDLLNRYKLPNSNYQCIAVYIQKGHQTPFAIMHFEDVGYKNSLIEYCEKPKAANTSSSTAGVSSKPKTGGLYSSDVGGCNVILKSWRIKLPLMANYAYFLQDGFHISAPDGLYFSNSDNHRWGAFDMNVITYRQQMTEDDETPNSGIHLSYGENMPVAFCYRNGERNTFAWRTISNALPFALKHDRDMLFPILCSYTHPEVNYLVRESSLPSLTKPSRNFKPGYLKIDRQFDTSGRLVSIRLTDSDQNIYGDVNYLPDGDKIFRTPTKLAKKYGPRFINYEFEEPMRTWVSEPRNEPTSADCVFDGLYVAVPDIVDLRTLLLCVDWNVQNDLRLIQLVNEHSYGSLEPYSPSESVTHVKKDEEFLKRYNFGNTPAIKPVAAFIQKDKSKPFALLYYDYVSMQFAIDYCASPIENNGGNEEHNSDSSVCKHRMAEDSWRTIHFIASESPGLRVTTSFGTFVSNIRSIGMIEYRKPLHVHAHGIPISLYYKSVNDLQTMMWRNIDVSAAKRRYEIVIAVLCSIDTDISQLVREPVSPSLTSEMFAAPTNDYVNPFVVKPDNSPPLIFNIVKLYRNQNLIVRLVANKELVGEIEYLKNDSAIFRTLGEVAWMPPHYTDMAVSLNGISQLATNLCTSEFLHQTIELVNPPDKNFGMQSLLCLNWQLRKNRYVDRNGNKLTWQFPNKFKYYYSQQSLTDYRRRAKKGVKCITLFCVIGAASLPFVNHSMQVGPGKACEEYVDAKYQRSSNANVLLKSCQLRESKFPKRMTFVQTPSFITPRDTIEFTVRNDDTCPYGTPNYFLESAESKNTRGELLFQGELLKIESRTNSMINGTTIRATPPPMSAEIYRQKKDLVIVASCYSFARDGTTYDRVSTSIPLKLPERHFYPEVEVIKLTEEYLKNNDLIRMQNSEPLFRTSNIFIFDPRFGEFRGKSIENFHVEYMLEDDRGNKLKVENNHLLPSLFIFIPEEWKGRVVHLTIYLQDADGTVYTWKIHAGFIYQ